MISVFSSIKEVLAFTVICIVCGTGDTKGNPDFKIRFIDSKHQLAIRHEITKSRHKITVGPVGAPGKAKVITLPMPLKGNWKDKVKLENSKGNGKGNGKGEKDKGKKAKGKKDKGKQAKGKKDKGKKAKGKKDKGKKAKGKGKKAKGKKAKGKKAKGKKASGRIVGGNEVEPPHALPWQVVFVQKRSPLWTTCGATIICPKYILFAAHCIEEVVNQERTGKILDPKDYLIVAGAHNMKDRSEPSRTEHKIKKFTVHPKRTDWTYDFAVIELADKIKIKPEARAAFLPKESDQKKLNPSVTLVVSGWGDLENNARRGSALLMYAKVPFVSDSKCYHAYGAQLGPTKESVFCAGYYEEGGIDACQGDSGGPLTMFDEDQVKLIGVVSAGGDCARAHQPGLYAKTTLVLDWINKVTGSCNAKTCQKGNCVTGEDLGAAQRYYNSE